MARQQLNISEEIPVRSRIYQIKLGEPAAKELQRGEGRCRLYPGPNKTYYVSQLSLDYLKDNHHKPQIVQEMSPRQLGLKVIYPLEMILHNPPPETVLEEVSAYALSARHNGKIPTPVYCGRTRESIPGTFCLDRPGGKRHYRWRWDRRKRKRPPRQIKDLFPKLIKRMTDPDTRFVISLGGGGLRLFAHPSLFKLIEELGGKDSIEEVWGCSGGALAGLSYCLGADHEVIEQEGYRIYHHKFRVELEPRNKPPILNILRKQILGERSIGLKGFVDVQKTLQKALARVAKHKRPSIPFYAVAYNISHKKNEVLTPEKGHNKIYRGLIKACSAMDAVLASTAVPILFVPRVIKRGQTSITYIDGGVSEELPLRSIHKKWLIDRKHGVTKKKKLFILSVNLFPQLAEWKLLSYALVRHLPLIKYLNVLTKLADLLRHSRIEEQIHEITRNRDEEVYTLTLGTEQMGGFLDPEIIPRVIDRAKGTFFQQLRSIEQQLI